ncbi:desulfoferrodoxin [uncultured Methanoregula sp.]|uniref:desulfoferrodoxin n=1 Tax=uncultured Methanoregula sp. TaxID=1005933 RepID=UPI002AABCFEB|nr:desulfoferrodoxin [uncultured Methanoregula sp.]
MTKLFEVYKCEVCGNITKVVHASGGTMVCCGKPMTLQVEKTADAGKEKHVPVIEKSSKGIIVKVGSIPHPMEEKHYIEWVEVRHGENVFIRGFKPGEKPEAEFCIADVNVRAREYCSVHGLWTNKA